MNKLGQNIIDDAEDIEIKKVANSKNISSINIFLLNILIMLFLVTLFITIKYIKDYRYMENSKNAQEIIEIRNKKTSATIINNGIIDESISSNSFENKKELIIENVDLIEIMPNENVDKQAGIIFDVKYNIIRNDFNESNIPTNNSELLVKFAYSFDNENWTYINNVISTDSSNITPLLGNTYDIAGIKTKLNIATDYALNIENNKSKKMYWKSETIFKKRNIDINFKKLEAEFTIEYKSSI